MLFFNLLSDLNFTISLVVVVSITALFGIWINKKYEFGLVSIFFIVICFLLILNIAIDYVNYFKKVDNIMTTQEDWGAMGDYIGGILNPILTFITIIILLWTNHNQNKELKKQLERQDKESEKNDFDRMFTLMLEQHNAFFLQKDFSENITNIYNELTTSRIRRADGVINFNWTQKTLESIFSEGKHNTINAYLRFLYRFLKYLDDNENNVSCIYDYSGLLRSFISEHLLYVIAMNGLRNPSSISKFEDYRKYLNKFKFLEHINLEQISMMMTNDIQLIKIASYFQHINKKNDLEDKLKANLKEPKKNDYLTQLEQENLTIKNFQNEILKLNLNENFKLSLYIKYTSSAFDQNPYYINNILPILKFFVENDKLPKELLNNE
ncbi:hypothetical protein GCM10023211_21550 [Orbus sasakiae]|uniref:Phage abortive infection protein n=1 Tax=Orbus sasakiae TaxID=1078475 RepID=A0ABP9NEV3_9GAMM